MKETKKRVTRSAKKADLETGRPEIMTSRTFKGEWFKGEINNLPSETIPDDALTIQEMLYKHVNGILDYRTEMNYYEDEDEIPLHLKRNFDLTDLDDEKHELELMIKTRLENERMDSRSSSSSGSSGDRAEPDSEKDGSAEHSSTSEVQSGTSGLSGGPESGVLEDAE